MARVVRQRTIVAVMGALRGARLNYVESLYAVDFPDWFIEQCGIYSWNWTRILIDIRNGRFFKNPYPYTPSDSITGYHLSTKGAQELGESLIQKLAAFASTLNSGDDVLRSLELDGFGVDKTNLRLVPLEGPVSPREEEDRLTALVKKSGVPDSATILQHISDANVLYAQGKDHPSLGESRNILQSLVDGISTETAAAGKYSTKLPGGTGPRIGYLKDVGFLTADEQAAFNSAWGSLSAGTHPGVPDREQARIGLILALEFGQLMLLKFNNWKANAYCGFS